MFLDKSLASLLKQKLLEKQHTEIEQLKQKHRNESDKLERELLNDFEDYEDYYVKGYFDGVLHAEQRRANIPQEYVSEDFFTNPKQAKAYWAAYDRGFN